MRKSLALVVTVLLSTASVAAAEVVTRTNWVPTGPGVVGDVWTFSCPVGGTFDLTVDTTSPTIDPLFSVLDSAGVVVTGADDTVPCVPASCFGCPQVLATPCTGGGTYSILVSAGTCGSASGGGYELTLEVKDAAAVSVDAKKVKLGGGPKSKVPAWHTPTSTPAVDDGKLY